MIMVKQFGSVVSWLRNIVYEYSSGTWLRSMVEENN
jgi:hypothetical protein